MIANAERDARDGAEDLRQRLRTEVSALEALREHLRTDAGRLEAHIAIQRQRVLATVEELQRLTSDPDTLREAPVPEFKPVDAVPTAEAMGGGTPPAPPAPPPPVHALDEEGPVTSMPLPTSSPRTRPPRTTTPTKSPPAQRPEILLENADEALLEDEITGGVPRDRHRRARGGGVGRHWSSDDGGAGDRAARSTTTTRTSPSSAERSSTRHRSGRVKTSSRKTRWPTSTAASSRTAVGRDSAGGVDERLRRAAQTSSVSAPAISAATHTLCSASARLAGRLRPSVASATRASTKGVTA